MSCEIFGARSSQPSIVQVKTVLVTVTLHGTTTMGPGYILMMLELHVYCIQVVPDLIWVSLVNGEETVHKHSFFFIIDI